MDCFSLSFVFATKYDSLLNSSSARLVCSDYCSAKVAYYIIITHSKKKKKCFMEKEEQKRKIHNKGSDS